MTTIPSLDPVHYRPGVLPASMTPKNKVQHVFEQFFSSTSKKPASATTADLVNSTAIAVDLSSDAVVDVADFSHATISELQSEYTAAHPHSEAMDAGEGVAGIPTGLNTLRGAIATHAAWKHHREAHESGDPVSVAESRIDLARGVTQTATGLTHVGLRATTIGTTLSPHVSILASLMTFLSTIGEILLLPLYALLGAFGYVRKKECDEFAAKLEELTTPQEKLQFLIDLIYGSEEELTAIESVDRVLILELLHQKFPALQPGGITKLEGLSLAEQDELLKLILNTAYQELVELKQLHANHLQGKNLIDQLGRLLNLQQMQQRKIAHLSRVIDGDTVAKIQHAAKRGLQPRAETEAGAIEVDSLIKEVTAAQAKISHAFKLLAWIGMIGTLMSIPGALVGLSHLLVGVAFLALFASNPFTLAGLILLVILIGLMLYLDIGNLRNSLDKEPEALNKTILWTSLTAVLLSLAGIITVAVLLPFSPWILAISLVIGVGIALYYIRMLHAISHAEKKWDLAHPKTVENFREAVQSKGSEVDATAQVFKTLPKAVRHAVTAKLQKEKFITPHYKELNEDLQFGRNYLWNYLNGKSINEIEAARIERAVKKATKSLWTSWWYAAAHEKANIKRQALEVDKLLQLLKKKQIVEARAQYLSIDQTLKESIHHRVWSIFIREEDSDRLTRAVEEVLPLLKAG